MLRAMTESELATHEIESAGGGGGGGVRAFGGGGGGAGIRACRDGEAPDAIMASSDHPNGVPVRIIRPDGPSQRS